MASLAQTPTAVTPTEKIRRETKTPTSQELAKDPGPKQRAQQQQQQQNQQQKQPGKQPMISGKVFKGNYSLKHYAGIATMAKEGEAGSNVLQEWRKEFPNKFLEPAQRYDAPLQYDDSTNWEMAAETVFEFCGTIEEFEKLLYLSWDRDNFGNERDSTEATNQWNIRRFSEAIASQDPTVLFDVKDDRLLDEDGDESLASKYWDHTVWYNPKLIIDAHVLAKMWVLCSITLGHPWTASSEREVDEIYAWKMKKRREVQASKAKKRNRQHEISQNEEEQGRARAPHQPATPEKPGLGFRMIGRTVVDDESGDVEMTEAEDSETPSLSFTNLVARTVDAIHESRQTMERAWAAAENQDESIELQGDKPSKNTRSKTKKKRVQIAEEEDGNEGTKPIALSAFTLSRPKTATAVAHDPSKNSQEEIEGSSEEETQWEDEALAEPPKVKVAAKDKELYRLGMRTPERGPHHNTNPRRPAILDEDDEVEAEDDDDSVRRLYNDVAATTPALQPDEEKLANLVQLDMNGLPVKHCRIVAINVAFNWTGSHGGRSSISRKCVEALHKLWEALFDTQSKYKILPIRDDRFRKQKLWLCDKKSLKLLAGQWHQVKHYIDMDFGNASWLPSQHNRPGDQRTLKTRIRVASDETEETMIATITSILEEDGGRCDSSPIQFCPAVRTGCFPFYPLDLSIPTLVMFIVKYLNFEAAVGIDVDWMAIPNNRNRNTWKPGAPSRSTGIRLLHVWTKEADAKMVDAALRQLFRPSTPKKDFPYGAVTQYVHDWRSVEKKLLSVGPYRPVRDLVSSMAQKAIDFRSVTETICSPVPIPGMLKKVVTEKYGEISLLRFLLAIVATPEQAALATTEKDTGSNGQDTGEESGQDSDGEAVHLPGAAEGFFQVVEKKQSKKKKKAESQKQALLAQAANKALYDNRRSGNEEANQRAEAVRKRDRENLDSAILFQLIFPEQTPGFFCLVCREKFAPLGDNVVHGLPAFIVKHLEESSRKREDEILRKWVGAAELNKLRRRQLIWDTDLMCARPATDTSNGKTDSSLDWLDFGRDILDQTAGFLSIDMEMADVRDFDDGATVAGALDELRAAEIRMGQMVEEISIQGEENAKLGSENARLAARVRELEEQQARALETHNPRSTRPTGKVARAVRGGGSSTKGP